MEPELPLPYDTSIYASVEEYIDSLLHLITSHDLLRTLCGGVHVLDFFTSTPDLYSRLLPQEWRDFFAGHEMMDILDFLMREDLASVVANEKWRGGPVPPESLVEYVRVIRKHLLDREPKVSQCARNRTQKKLPRQVTVGMNVKKVHEVGIFSSHVDSLANHVSSRLPDEEQITHLLDLGSGQSYLGRALASKPYERNVVAVERKSHNTERAGELDVKARLVEKNWKWRNKKAFRAGLVPSDKDLRAMVDLPTPPPEPTTEDHGMEIVKAKNDLPEEAKGRIQHVSVEIDSGDLTSVISQIDSDEKNLLVISLHSCGNLLHHGLRSLTLNPSVKAVALVGCCYNLLTERLGPATYKHASLLRPPTHIHPRVEREGQRCDPDGFPMSEKFCNYDTGDGSKGVRMNITARMMAVQAPANWGPKDSESSFTRHFYRALLQKVFLDYGVVGPPCEENVGTLSASGHSSGGTPILIGTLPKSAYTSFSTYVHAAVAKLYEDAVLGPIIESKMSVIADAELAAYEDRFRARRKDLSVVWSLMAFSAGVIEAAIVVDRWLWLKEQEEVSEAWVEAVFDYGISPRNLVVVGVKK